MDMDASATSSSDDWEIIPEGSPSPKKRPETTVVVLVPPPPPPPPPPPTIQPLPVDKPAFELLTMPGWKDQYILSIREAEKDNPVNGNLVEACSQLSDRIAALEAEKAVWQATPTKSTATGGGPGRATSEPPASSTDPSVARLRLDLAEALRAKGQLESRLLKAEGERDVLRSRKTTDTRNLRDVTAERNALRTAVRDRDEELRAKSKMLENLQDEVLALNLQLNVAEQQRTKVQAENKQLIDRWMKRVGQEAEDMNRANEPKLAKGR